MITDVADVHRRSRCTDRSAELTRTAALAHPGEVPRLRPVGRLTELDVLTTAQQGALSRAQALDHGMTDKQVRRALVCGDWRSSGFPGSYLTFSGPVPYTSRCWAALLYAGAGAVLSHETAAWVWGLRDEVPREVHVTVPVTRRVRPQRGRGVHYALHCMPANAGSPRQRTWPSLWSLARRSADVPSSQT